MTVFEADGRAGGKLRSVMHNGLIWDEGANTMVVCCFYSCPTFFRTVRHICFSSRIYHFLESGMAAWAD